MPGARCLSHVPAIATPLPPTAALQVPRAGRVSHVPALAGPLPPTTALQVPGACRVSHLPTSNQVPGAPSVPPAPCLSRVQLCGLHVSKVPGAPSVSRVQLCGLHVSRRGPVSQGVLRPDGAHHRQLHLHGRGVLEGPGRGAPHGVRPEVQVDDAGGVRAGGSQGQEDLLRHAGRPENRPGASPGPGRGPRTPRPQCYVSNDGAAIVSKGSVPACNPMGDNWVNRVYAFNGAALPAPPPSPP